MRFNGNDPRTIQRRRRAIRDFQKHPVRAIANGAWGARSRDYKLTIGTGVTAGTAATITMAALEGISKSKQKPGIWQMNSEVERKFGEQLKKVEEDATQRIRQEARKLGITNTEPISIIVEKITFGTDYQFEVRFNIPIELQREKKIQLKNAITDYANNTLPQKLRELSNSRVANYNQYTRQQATQQLNSMTTTDKVRIAGAGAAEAGLVATMLGLLGIKATKKAISGTKRIMTKIRDRKKQNPAKNQEAQQNEPKLLQIEETVPPSIKQASRKIGGEIEKRSPIDLSAKTKVRYITMRLPTYVPKEVLTSTVGLLQEAMIKNPWALEKLDPTNITQVRALLENLAEEKAREQNKAMQQQAQQIIQRPQAKFGVKFNKRATNKLEKLPPMIRGQIKGAIERLAVDPQNSPSVKGVKISRKVFRLRAGDYRVLFKFVEGKQNIEIIKIDSRSNIFRRIGRQKLN